jgi:hypothetical protein
MLRPYDDANDITASYLRLLVQRALAPWSGSG